MLHECGASTITPSCDRRYFQFHVTSGSVIAEAICQIERIMNPRVFERRSLISCQKTHALSTFIIRCKVTRHDQKECISIAIREVTETTANELSALQLLANS